MCDVIESYRGFGGTRCPHLQDRNDNMNAGRSYDMSLSFYQIIRCHCDNMVVFNWLINVWCFSPNVVLEKLALLLLYSDDLDIKSLSGDMLC